MSLDPGIIWATTTVCGLSIDEGARLQDICRYGLSFNKDLGNQNGVAKLQKDRNAAHEEWPHEALMWEAPDVLDADLAYELSKCVPVLHDPCHEYTQKWSWS